MRQQVSLPYQLPGADHAAGCRQIRARPAFFTGTNSRDNGRAILQPALGRAHPGRAPSAPWPSHGELIAAVVRRAFRVVRQPILVGVDAHQVLQRARQADLLVRLELGQVDQDIRVHRRAAEQIFVALARARLLRHVVRRPVESPCPGNRRTHWRRPGGRALPSGSPAAWSWRPPPVDRSILLAADSNSSMLPRETPWHGRARVESAVPAQVPQMRNPSEARRRSRWNPGLQFHATQRTTASITAGCVTTCSQLIGTRNIVVLLDPVGRTHP